ncbi:P-type conjugative transfer protein TrbL [Ralstonia thomasii]|uniref:P-type conjugative transfer protein TrbL n=1 Tax=Ralstonia thomasii TaxID=3058596 RepID=UPI003C2E6456
MALIAACLLLFAPDLFANQVLDNIGQSYKDATGGWSSALSSIARGLFIKLAGIELVWAGIWWVMEKDDPNAVIVSMLRIVMGLMFFWAILLNFDTWIPAVIDGFSKAGQTAGGMSALTPSTVLDTGLVISTKLLAAVKDMSLWDDMGTIIVAGISALGILLAFAVIAGQMLVTLVESYFSISAGVLFLGFAGSRWTTTFAEKYISYAVSIGVKLFVTYLVIAAGQSVSNGWADMMKPGMQTSDYLVVLCGAGIYMFLGWQIPQMASSMLTGSVSMTLGSAMATGATMVGGVAGVAAAGAALGSKGGREAVGALRAASEAAGQGSASGGGAFSMVANAAGAVGSAVAGNVSDGVKGFGKDSIGGRLADRMAANGASMAEAAAAGPAPAAGAAAAQPPAPTTPPAANAAAAATPAAGGAAAHGNASATGVAGAAAAGALAPAGTAGGGGGGRIDTSTSLSQALAQRDAGVGGAGGAGSSAPAAGDGSASGADASSASSVSAPPQPAAPSQAQPPAPGTQNPEGDRNKRSTREKVADGLSALGNQPNDAAAGAGIQIGMRLHD